MSVRLIKPIEGKRVRDPETGAVVTAAGVRVPEPIGTYWDRRVRDGDVTADLEPAPKRARRKE